jgi:hypothetical protein
MICSHMHMCIYTAVQNCGFVAKGKQKNDVHFRLLCEPWLQETKNTSGPHFVVRRTRRNDVLAIGCQNN